MNKLTFLFGAGISIPAGFPTTKKITSRILSGKGISRHTDGNYYLETNNIYNLVPDEYVPRIIELLKVLRVEILNYYHDIPDRYVNYEELYYLASQIYDSETGEFDNPAVGAVSEKVRDKLFLEILKPFPENMDQWDLLKVASEAVDYIVDVVHTMLTQTGKDTKHLNSLKDAILDDELKSIDIFTLNHDTMIEECLRSNDIPFTDGFGTETHGARWWEPKLFDTPASKVRLMKLHGSVDWYWMETKPDGAGLGNLGIPLNGDHWHVINPQGQSVMSLRHRPMILTGTFNKLMQYSTIFFADLHYHFHHSLQKINHIVISGYSFGDKGINTKIAEWLLSSEDKRMIVVHQDERSLKENARRLISKNWDSWKNEGELILIPKWIEDTSWKEIKNIINLNSSH